VGQPFSPLPCGYELKRFGNSRLHPGKGINLPRSIALPSRPQAEPDFPSENGPPLSEHLSHAPHQHSALYSIGLRLKLTKFLKLCGDAVRDTYKGVYSRGRFPFPL